MRRVGALVLSAVLAAGCKREESVRFDPVAASADAIVVLVFVTTECPISNRYAPTLQGLAQRFGGRGVEFFAVYPDPDDDAQAVEDHRRAYGLGFSVLRDPEHELARLAGARVTPEAAVYSAGAIVYRGRIDDRALAFGTFRAAAQHEDLANAIEATLAGSAVDPPTSEAVGCYIADLR
jgi:thiol-disulfide isomerase/thioredoxin